jgi:hypothetical protein
MSASTASSATVLPWTSDIGRLVSLRGQVAEDEAVSLDDVAGRAGDGLGEDRAGMDEGVEFAVLAAGVDPRRQFGEKLIVVRPPGERGVERARVEADEDRLEAGGNELPRELAGVAAPEREQSERRMRRWSSPAG